jgi:hypothetical protein
MKIENLKEGMVFKNYKELCETLNEKVKYGNSKKSQIDNWKKYFEFKKEKQSYTIVEIYDIPKTTTYLEKVELLLLNLMARSEKSNYTIFSPKTSLLENLNIINKNYKLCKKHDSDFASFANIEIDAVYEFFQSVSSSATYQLEQVLSKLESKMLISYNTIDMVCCLEENDSITDIINEHENGNQKNIDEEFEKIEIYRRATQEEVEYSLEIKKKVLEQLNCETGRDAIAKGVYHVFADRCANIFMKEKNIKFFYKAYEIIFHKPNIDISLNDLVEKYKLSEQEHYQITHETNIEHMDNIINNANKRVDKANRDKAEIKLDELLKLNFHKDKIAEYIGVSKYSIDSMLLRSDENYISNMEKLIEILIKNDAKYIIPKLNKYINEVKNGK